MKSFGNRKFAAVLAVSTLMLGACAQEESTTNKIVLTGDPWEPSVSGVAASNHDSSVTISKSVVTAGGLVTGLAQGWSGREITVDIDMTQDLGAGGSLSLVGEVFNFPSSALSAGSAYAILTSLHDGTNELVNLARTGSGGDCAQSGAYTCPGNGTCSENSACSISWPSAYFDRDHWTQKWLNSDFGSYAGTYTFPTCNWTGGSQTSTSAASGPGCAFADANFLVGGKLRSGVHYTAKFVLMASRYASIPNSSAYNAGLKVTIVKKSKVSATVGGAFDVNLIFVGGNVSQASRNAKGKINLDTLMTSLQEFYNQSNVGLKLGAIHAYEWTDGEAYAQLSTSQLGSMIASASSMLPASTEGKAVNIFLVSSFSDESSLLGISGGIGGPMVYGLRNSGVVVSTFDLLDQYNPDCSGPVCDKTQIEYDFADLELTIAHEVGHYLGLNHPSEADASMHDILRDTPVCTAKNASGRISISTCMNNDTNVFNGTGQTCDQACNSYNTITGVYCSAAVECQFNHMMYWSSKYFTPGVGTGDGNLFSAQSGQLINWHPIVQ